MQTIKVEGMSCGHCTSAVKKALEEANAGNVHVSLEEKQAQWDGKLSPQEVKEIIDGQGFVAIL